ncbi:cupredoxin domain-containing protein [Halegenticoccus soli]|uniref:cupredoxin domain-containing protein n=1 Tax=Halegenticoccus soli TaxID=1985678 RepID=UPI000C6DA00C|nr:plastocyanin/azurin family copper-binding protein [Halegenticoccus soli]
MNRRTFLASVGAAGLAGVAGCTALQFGPKNYDVGMRAVAFDPSEYTVSVGDEVVWTNTSSRAHTVTAYENSIPEGADYFASGGYDGEAAAREAWREDMGGALTSGQSYRHTFDVPGRYDYVCIPHEQGGMIGTIVVEK